MIESTPVPQIDLAMKGRVDFLKATNPFGSPDEEPKRALLTKLDRPKVAKDLGGLLRAMKKRGIKTR